MHMGVMHSGGGGVTHSHWDATTGAHTDLGRALHTVLTEIGAGLRAIPPRVK